MTPRVPLSSAVPRAAAVVLRGDREAHYFLVELPTGEPVLGGEELDGQDADNVHEPRWATASEIEELGLLPVALRPLVIDLLRP